VVCDLVQPPSPSGRLVGWARQAGARRSRGRLRDATTCAINSAGRAGQSSQSLTELKNDAAPQARVPAETNAANHRGSRDYDSRWHDNWCRGCDYDWTIRATSSQRTTMKAETTSLRSTSTVNIDERKQESRRCSRQNLRAH